MLTEWITNVNEETFDELVLKKSSEIPVVVDFWAEWCPPCKQLEPVLERVVTEMEGRFVLARVEVDDNMHLAGKYKLSGFPSILLFMGGHEIERFAGAKNDRYVMDFLETHLGDTDPGA